VTWVIERHYAPRGGRTSVVGAPATTRVPIVLREPAGEAHFGTRPHLTRTHAIGHLMAHHNSDRCHGEARQRQRVAGTGPAEGPAVPCLVVMAKVLPEHDLELPAAKDEDYGPCTCGERSSPSQPQSLH
jgi:hypothetical protein